jgi:putative methanogenesis marker protein 5
LVKVFIYPTNSFILADLVTRSGHEPLVVMNQVREKVTALSVDSPPLNITPKDPNAGLKYAAIEVPAGVRGRMALMGPLAEEAEAGIIIEDTPADFGCSGCNRANELVKYLVRTKVDRSNILEIRYPSNEEQMHDFVYTVMDFLKTLPADSGKQSEKQKKGGQKNE